MIFFVCTIHLLQSRAEYTTRCRSAGSLFAHATSDYCLDLEQLTLTA